MMKFAVKFGAPIAVRYPRGEAYDGLEECREPIVYGKSEMIFEEKEIALMAVGSMVKTAVEVREKLKAKGYSVTLVNGRFIKPIDTDVIEHLSKNHELIVTMEENVESGGFGEKVRGYVDERKFSMGVLNICVPDEYVEHGNVELLRKEIGIDADSIVEKIVKRMEK